jgi:hypothetical protein
MLTDEQLARAIASSLKNEDITIKKYTLWQIYHKAWDDRNYEEKGYLPSLWYFNRTDNNTPDFEIGDLIICDNQYGIIEQKRYDNPIKIAGGVTTYGVRFILEE